jgi:hypothetical protein
MNAKNNTTSGVMNTVTNALNAINPFANKKNNKAANLVVATNTKNGNTTVVATNAPLPSAPPAPQEGGKRRKTKGRKASKKSRKASKKTRKGRKHRKTHRKH